MITGFVNMEIKHYKSIILIKYLSEISTYEGAMILVAVSP